MVEEAFRRTAAHSSRGARRGRRLAQAGPHPGGAGPAARGAGAALRRRSAAAACWPRSWRTWGRWRRPPRSTPRSCPSTPSTTSPACGWRSCCAANGQLEDGGWRASPRRGRSRRTSPRCTSARAGRCCRRPARAGAWPPSSARWRCGRRTPALKEALRTLKGEAGNAGARYLVDSAPLLQGGGHLPQRGRGLRWWTTPTCACSRPASPARFHQLVVKVLTQRGVEAFRTLPITYSPDRQEVRVIARPHHQAGRLRRGELRRQRAQHQRAVDRHVLRRPREDAHLPRAGAGRRARAAVPPRGHRAGQPAVRLLGATWSTCRASTRSSATSSWWTCPRSAPLYWNKPSWPGVKATQERAGRRARALPLAPRKSVPKVVPEPGMPGWAEVAVHPARLDLQDLGSGGPLLLGPGARPAHAQRRAEEDRGRTCSRAWTARTTRRWCRAIYDFVVTNTRYVALEFGIHGYKPYRVDRVLARRFGDCKDKASLIHAMLKVAGVDSRLVLLRMRQPGHASATSPRRWRRSTTPSSTCPSSSCSSTAPPSSTARASCPARTTWPTC